MKYKADDTLLICDVLKRGDKVSLIQYWDSNSRIQRIEVNNSLLVEDSKEDGNEDLESLKLYVKNTYKAAMDSIKIPKFTCPLINTIQDKLRESTDPKMLELVEMLEQVRASNSELRETGKKFKRLANQLKWRLSVYKGHK